MKDSLIEMTDTSSLRIAFLDPYTTEPTFQTSYPYFSLDSSIKSLAFSFEIMQSRPPEVSAEKPFLTLKSCILEIFRSILSITGIASNTKSTSLYWAAAKF